MLRHIYKVLTFYIYEEHTDIAHTRNLSIQRIQKTIYMYFKDLKAYSIQIVLLLSLKFLLPFYMKNDCLVPSMHNTLKQTHFQVRSSTHMSYSFSILRYDYVGFISS